MPLLDSTPREIILYVLSYCDYLSILRFSSTCRLYHELIDGSSLVQLQIELGASGFQLSDRACRSRNEATASQLLDKFRRYRDGWLYLRVGTTPRVGNDASTLNSSTLQQGIQAQALVRSQLSPATFRLTHLSTGVTRTLSPGLFFSNFRIDPGQDLLVLALAHELPSPRSTIYLRSLQDGSPHNDARHSDWNVTHPFYLGSDMFIEVSGDLLAIQCSYFGKQTNEILIWDWKNAILLSRIQSDGLCYNFTFLTSDSLVLVHTTYSSPRRMSLLIYQDVSTPQTSLANSSASDFIVSEYGLLAPRACFELPTLAPGSSVYLYIRSEPAPATTSSFSSSFSPLPETRILLLTMAVGAPVTGGGTTDHRIFISIQRLLAHISGFSDQTGLVQDPVRISWTDWGEYSTRWFAYPWTHHSMFGSYGTRSVQHNLFSNDEELPSQEHVSVLDFHTPTVRRFSSLGRDAHLAVWPSKDTRRHIDLCSAHEDLGYRLGALRNAMAANTGDPVFVDTIDEDVPSEVWFNGATIRTRLPYRIVTRVQPFSRHSSWMMDSNSIVGRSGSDAPSKRIHIYTPYA